MIFLRYPRIILRRGGALFSKVVKKHKKKAKSSSWGGRLPPPLATSLPSNKSVWLPVCKKIVNLKQAYEIMSISSKTTKSSIEITKYHVSRYGEGEKVAVLHQFTARTIPGDFMELGILFCSCFVFWPRMFKAKTCIVLSVF